MAFYSSWFENTAAITLLPAWHKKAQQQHTVLDLPAETKNKVRFIFRVYEKGFLKVKFICFLVHVI